MLFLNGHGAHLQSGGDPDGQTALKRAMAAACGFGPDEYYPDPKTIPLGTFGYMFPVGASTPPDPDIAARMDALAVSMVDQAPPEDDNSDAAALFTYIGQFIDHDVTAGTDRESDFSKIDVAAPDLAQHSRDAVREKVANLRTGALDLDSVYGTNLHVGAFGKKLREAMRHPQDRAKLLVGTAFDFPDCRPDLPHDPATDLLRLERVVDPARPLIPLAEFSALTGPAREPFFDEAGAPILSRAILGDMRNDENLAVAQTHLMFIRLHNKIVDAARSKDVDLSDRDKVFDWARRQVQHIYQWLIVNAYLPEICDADVLADVLAHDAPVYETFITRVNGGVRSVMAIPLEFSVAAFRFGHTQARPDYDWNQIFGRGETACVPSAERATFRNLFRFTGSGLHANAALPTRVPTNWIPEMERLLNTGNDWFADRNTRKIDTFLAPDLLDMANEPAGMLANMKNLPIRNLRRAHVLNIPTAQACIAALDQQNVAITPLSEPELTSGHTGAALAQAGLTEHTPLWFYILKEAELQQGGKRLGQLGSRIVAETLAGLVIHGQDTYWTRPGTDQNDRWTPADGVTIAGRAVDSFPAMMSAVGYL